MADQVTILSTLSAIEDAINRDGDALAILQNARNVLTAVPEPVATAKQRLHTALNDVDLELNDIDSLINVCNFALRAQSCDLDADVARVLDATWNKVRHARDCIVTATELLAEVAP